MAENNNNRPQDEVSLAEENRARARAKRGGARVSRGKRHALNLFDLIVIFVVLVAVVLFAVGVRVSDLFGGDDETGRACRVEYSVTFSNVDEAFASSIVQGDALSNADTKAALGTVHREVTVVPHTMAALQPSAEAGGEATVVMTEVPGRVDITVTVQADASYTAGVGYTVNGKAIRVGGSYTVRFPNFVGTGVCVALDELIAS